MAYTNGSSIKKVLIDGVLHPINDYRVEGTNFAVTQIAGDIAIGTPLTTEQLEHITEPVMSADGCIINAPALGTILIPKNVVFNPAATEDYVISYVSSPLEGKTYNLKITMDHTTGLPKEAVFAEEEVAAPPTNILKTKLDTYKTEFAKPAAERDPAIVAEAKVFGNDVLSKKPNIIVELDADNQPVEVFHATESPDPAAYYRYVNGKNECIDIYYDNSTDPYTTTDLAFPDLENIYVEKAKEYMEIHTTANTVVYKSTKPVMIDEDTLGFTQTEEATQGQGVDGIIHYPKSVLFTSDNAFQMALFAFADAYTPDAKFEISKDGINWETLVWDESLPGAMFEGEFNSTLGKYAVFIRGNNHFNEEVDMDAGICKACKFVTASGSDIEVSGILESLWGGKPIKEYECFQLFSQLSGMPQAIVSVKNLIFPNTTASCCYMNMFSHSQNLIYGPNSLPATVGADNCYFEMFQDCTQLTHAPLILATTLGEGSCHNMFQYAQSLTQAPPLYATTMGAHCCEGMFEMLMPWDTPNNLMYAGEICATSVGECCCLNMFKYCDKLIGVPSVLPAETLSDFCYQNMFSGCTSLAKAPALPATTLAEGCYDNMFDGCHSLTSTPELPAITMAATCYQGMFSSCISLTKTPVLPATTLADGCYCSMFYNCTSLTKTPVLPVTTLANACYMGMFGGCTSLTTTPELPAIILPRNCYDGMFKGCTSLTRPITFPIITPANNQCLRDMFRNCSGIAWTSETTGVPYEIKTTDGSTALVPGAAGIFLGNSGDIPEGITGSPKANTTYYLAV